MKLSNTNEHAVGGTLDARRSTFGVPGVMEEVERFCPECGAAMIEFDRLAEDGAVFIWYACSREDCTGQWLTKKALRMRSV
jgi:hypothetical protein